MSRTGESSETDTLEKQLLRHQTELVIKRFASLAEVDFIGSVRTPTDLSIERLRTKKGLLTEVHSTLLPLLKQQIASISEALRALDDVRKDPGLVLKLILDIQPKVDQTLDQTIRALNDIIPGRIPPPKQTHDRHFRELKCYRLHGFSCVLKGDLPSDINATFLDCKQQIEMLQLSSSDHRGGDLTDSYDLHLSIDMAIRWAAGSELDIICNNSWKVEMSEPRDLPETDTLGKQLLRHQAELAIKRFASLADVSSIVADTNLTDLSIERLRSKKDLLTEVHSTQLPLLKEQITLISDALGHPDQVRNDPGPTIQRVLEIQPILEQTLDQTIRAIHEILPGIVPPPEQTYDRHFRELKCFRLHGLNRVFRGRFASDVNTFFLACKRRIEILQLSTSDDGQGPVDSSRLVESSDIVIRWATSPELDIIYARDSQ
ncbi:hypothetical protein PSHT_14416 [Puccinia striiformis]|uniref:Uncharacterized protein n=1 Tax=Puccinia striiformis TaxID=27350 RepID=A0A2S4UKI7_9BASI|nr:hypothetical protein PSHT_14416 [Puccinia striiformis]